MSAGRPRGFTLMEFMIALVVVSLLALAAVPSFTAFVADSRMTAITNALVAHLNIARSEAIKRGVPVAVCVSPDAVTCTGSTRWDQGWMVFVDNNGVAGQRDGGDRLVAVMAPDAGSHILAGDSGLVRYGPLGSVID